MGSSPKETALSFWVRAKPGAKRLTPLCWVDLGDGKRAVEVSVNAPAVDGKANEAVLARLAKEIGTKKRCLSVKTGDTSRLKQIIVDDEATEETQAFLASLS